ncbi:DNA alkylation repair protein [Paenalkalicoccus suaedae]|uniref:DNA alkylation repair protein n=1 Tax=Paenalkalicoccus suaedae TaxID=2592382 RepID=A0A859FJR6_9BACI|nr:DNA alkylation repair protein [Paenalkalicoccus suaedae]QKS73051.1 DNA alkylation repair protein [Paenalkalicoccus suaedae]
MTASFEETYVRELQALYAQHAEEEFASWSQKYMRDQFAFIGIRTPVRRKIMKEFMKEHGLPPREHLQDVVLALWELPEREYQYAALDLLNQAKKQLGPADMPWLTSLIVHKSWWDTIDVLSPHLMGHLFTAHPELLETHADSWIKDENIWLQRSAILYQLNYKAKSDEARLYRYILTQASSDEFFVQKAIGWALRQYARTNPSSVQKFVDTHELKPLSKREAVKHLT